MIITPARRTATVREYYFSRKLREIDAMNAERLARGEDKIISLGIGAPDRMPPADAIDALVESARRPGNHAYQNYTGIPQLREAFSDWYRRWYGVELDPRNEVQPLVGSKEGILLISLAYLNPGDKVLVPDPGYPTYTSASKLAEAEIITYDLQEKNHWLPDFDALERMDLSGVKILWTNYPHMPTGAKATPELFRKLVDFGRRHGILVVNDNPYSFVLCDRPLSILASEGAKDVCLELNSLSKAHNMSGWRIGMVGGSAELVAEVLKVKSQMDSGMFKPLQLAAIAGLRSGPEWFEALNTEYARRRVAAGRIFDLLGAPYDPDSAGLFLWGNITRATKTLVGEESPEPTPADRLSDLLLHEAGVFMTPGSIFGKNGRDYLRVSLCAPVEILDQARDRISRYLRDRNCLICNE
jgi:aspartate/methionine/tyrosine aminotransferase